MAAKTPRRLFKYQAYSAQTLTSLKARALWLGKPSSFNDPFDCAVPLKFRPFTVADAHRVPADKRKGWWGELKRFADSYDSHGRPSEALRADLEAGARAMVEEQRIAQYESVGVTCLSETHDNSLLWSHYGHGHHGVCLEFDTSSPLLQRLHKVRYVDRIPEIDLAKLLVHDSSQVISGLDPRKRTPS